MISEPQTRPCKRCGDTGLAHFERNGCSYVRDCDCPVGLRRTQVSEAAKAAAQEKADRKLRAHMKRAGRAVVQRDFAADQGKFFGAGKD